MGLHETAVKCIKGFVAPSEAAIKCIKVGMKWRNNAGLATL